MKNDLKLEFVELNEDENPIFDEKGNYVILDEIDINKNVGLVLPDEYVAVELYKLNYNKYFYTEPKEKQESAKYKDCYIGECIYESVEQLSKKGYATKIKNGNGFCFVFHMPKSFEIQEGIYYTVAGFKAKYITAPAVVPIWVNQCNNTIKNYYDNLNDIDITEEFREIVRKIGFPTICSPLVKCDADISFITDYKYVNIARKKLPEFLKYVSFEYPNITTYEIVNPYDKKEKKEEVNGIAYWGLCFIDKYFLYEILDEKDYWNLLSKITIENGTSYELISYADIAEEEIEYLWYPYIPLGAIVLFAGDPGVGKSTIATKMASIVSTGGKFPFSDERSISLSPSDVIIQNGEDFKGATIRHKLEQYGADISKIWLINDDINSPFKVSKLDVLERNLYLRRPKLVIIDPITQYLPSKISMDRANEVRDALSPLVDLAERYKCTFLIIAHKNKNTNTNDIYRVLGSIDFVGICRSMLMAQEINGKKYLKQVKNSTAKFGKPIEYHIDDYRLDFIRQVDENLDNVSSEQPIEEAKRFILDQFKKGEVQASDIFELAYSEGISKSTLKRAKKELNIDSKEVVADDGNKYWVWVLSKTPDNIESTTENQKNMKEEC